MKEESEKWHSRSSTAALVISSRTDLHLGKRCRDAGWELILHCKIKHLCELRPAFHQLFHEQPFLKDTPSGPSSKMEFPSLDKFDCQFTNSIATCEAKDVIPVTVSAGVSVSLDVNCSTFFCKE